MSSVTIIDYGLGNLHSVTNAFRYVGADVTVSAEPRQISDASRLVLPGVGAFADGAKHLDARGLWGVLQQRVEAGVPLLGICLGMQLLFSESEEFGVHAGLGLIPGRVVPIPPAKGVKIPHVGWNRLHAAPNADWSDSPLAPATPGKMVYFVHSYMAVPENEDDRLANALVGQQAVTAAVRRNNIFGCQFHPEKSGPLGLQMLEHFLAS